MLACSAMVACTNDDLLENNDSPVVKGDKAYVVVNIKSANGLSSRGEPDGFEDGTDGTNGTVAENNVSTATFFFYDKEGKYVTKSASGTEFTAEATTDNVEKIAESVVVLEGLNGKNYPAYVVAVLNCPAEIVTKLHSEQLPLSSVKSVLVGESAYMNGNDFIMSNSTYKNGDPTSLYFATKLVDKNFLPEQPDEDEKEELMNADNVVNIYVERLAAKANLTLADNAKGKIPLTKYDVDGQDATLYVEVLNWKLNGTNKNSYLMKNVNVNFDAYEAGAEGVYAFDWAGAEATGYKRTYWGQSYNWETGTYPAGIKESSANNTLNYFSWDAMTPEEGSTTIGTAQYCAENTNSETALNTGNFHSMVTEVLLQAKVYTQIGDGEAVPTDLIRYNNTLFTKEGFIARVVKNAGLEGKLWKYSNYEGSWKGKSIEAKDFDYVNLGNGIVNVRLKDVERNDDGTIKNVIPTKNGDADEYKWYDKETLDGFDFNGGVQAATALTVEQLNAYEAAINALAIKAECYKDGMMYYNIPIEHLRGGKFEYVSGGKPATGDGADDTEFEDIKVNEADYGVVRNHYYNITVNKIENLGNAVLKPDEIIIPIDKNNTTYYVGATINILAWKVVNQSVDL